MNTDSNHKLLDGRHRWLTCMACLAPLPALAASLAWLSQHPFTEESFNATYPRHHALWGGNPAEVYSHWINFLLLSGNALAIAWLTYLEALLKTGGPGQRAARWVPAAVVVTGLVLSVAGGVMLDVRHGEGVCLLAIPLFFAPLIGGSWYLLRQFCRVKHWQPAAVAVGATVFALFHIVWQCVYEPSDTGAPNQLVAVPWLLAVVAAIAWALIQSARCGSLQVRTAQLVNAALNPLRIGAFITLAVAVVTPITWIASQRRQHFEQLAFPQLDALERQLSGHAVNSIMQEVASNEPDRKLPIPESARPVLAAAKTSSDFDTRVFIPVRDDSYLFLWNNSRFMYCDVRPIKTEHTVQMDHRFLEKLMRSGGTRQTGLYSILWSGYKAGRVLRDGAGNITAICVLGQEST